MTKVNSGLKGLNKICFNYLKSFNIVCRPMLEYMGQVFDPMLAIVCDVRTTLTQHYL